MPKGMRSEINKLHPELRDKSLDSKDLPKVNVISKKRRINQV